MQVPVPSGPMLEYPLQIKQNARGDFKVQIFFDVRADLFPMLWAVAKSYQVHRRFVELSNSVLNPGDRLLYHCSNYFQRSVVSKH